jgi:hypothetical protein
MDFDFIDVESSNIAAIAFDGDSHTLRVRFVSGDVWEYDDVSQQKHKGLMGAASVGKYFNSQIRGSHPGRKVG